MKVYILETGCYDCRGVRGIYATPEAAKAAWQPKPYDRHGTEWSYEWKNDDDYGWSFDADWDHAADIIEYEVLS